MANKRTTETRESSATIPARLAELDEEGTLAAVRERLADGVDPLAIIAECRQGIQEVGRRYEAGTYFISGLIMAGEIMHQVSAVVMPALAARGAPSGPGRVLVATVQGDIHYIGKNIFKVLLQCFGIAVLDAGEDVSAERLLGHVLAFRPQVVGLSCLISTGYAAIRETIAVLRQGTARLTPAPRLIIGGLVDATVCRHVGADGWADDAMAGVRLCRNLIDR